MMSQMRITVRIDDDLHRQLQDQARRERTTLTRVLNAALRRGIAEPRAKPRRHRQKTYNLGVPLVNLDKALSLADEWDDEERNRKMSLGR
jgi:hypothetical protein